MMGRMMLDKEKVTELVEQSGLHEFGYSNRLRFMTALAYFATAIQHEVLKLERGNAEPVAFEFQHEDTGLIDFVDPQQVEWGFQKNNPRWQLIGPVFRNPTPAVVRQLVDAVERLRQKAKWINDEQAIVPYDEMMELKAAPTAAKGETG